MERFDQLSEVEKRDRLLAVAKNINLLFADNYELDDLQEILLYSRVCSMCTDCKGIFESHLDNCTFCGTVNQDVENNLPRRQTTCSVQPTKNASEASVKRISVGVPLPSENRSSLFTEVSELCKQYYIKDTKVERRFLINNIEIALSVKEDLLWVKNVGGLIIEDGILKNGWLRFEISSLEDVNRVLDVVKSFGI